MDRRKSLKVMVLGTVSSGVLLDACKTDTNKNGTATKVTKKGGKHDGLMKEEVAELERINSETFFTPHEMKTITLLGDIIIPRDDVSGSASDAGVPDFIEFIAKDKPEHQVPMRGGLRWLDMQCLKRYKNSFAECDTKQQMEMVDEIAWPKKAKPEMRQASGKTFPYVKEPFATMPSVLPPARAWIGREFQNHERTAQSP